MLVDTLKMVEERDWSSESVVSSEFSESSESDDFEEAGCSSLGLSSYNTTQAATPIPVKQKAERCSKKLDQKAYCSIQRLFVS